MTFRMSVTAKSKRAAWSRADFFSFAAVSTLRKRSWYFESRSRGRSRSQRVRIVSGSAPEAANFSRSAMSGSS